MAIIPALLIHNVDVGRVIHRVAAALRFTLGVIDAVGLTRRRDLVLACPLGQPCFHGNWRHILSPILAYRGLDQS